MAAAGARKTDYRFKFLYAVGMVMILTIHANGIGISLLYDWFPAHGFAIALFVFCSGYFYKDRNEQNIPGYILKKARTLLLPLYLWNLFYGLLVWALRPLGFTIGLMPSFSTLVLMPLYEGSQFEYNMGSWYIAPMFMTEVANILLRRLFRVAGSRRRECAYFLGTLALGILGVWLSQRVVRTGWMLALLRLTYFLPFYALGIFYQRVLEEYDRVPDAAWYALLFFLQYLVVIIVGHFPVYTFSRCDNFTDGLLTPFIAGVLGLGFWLRTARLMEPTFARDKWVNIVADNSMSIMMNHFLGFMLVKTGFALLQRFTSRCQDFDLAQFKSNLVYFYAPGGRVFYIFYLAAGLLVPIGLQALVNLVKRRFARRRSPARV